MNTLKRLTLFLKFISCEGRMNELIKALGGVESAKKYLDWMEREGLLMGSYHVTNGRASFYDFTLRKAIEQYEKEKLYV